VKRINEMIVLPMQFGQDMIKALTERLRELARTVNNLLTGDVVVNGTLQIGGAASYAEFESDGTLEFHGAATVWDDMLGAAVNLQQQGPGVSTNLTENQVEFTTASNLSDYLIDSQQISHAWAGTAVSPHLHAWQTTSAAPNWLLQYRWQKMGAAKTTAWTYLRCNVPAFTYPGSGTFHQLFSTPTEIAPPAGAGISDILQFRILRDNNNTSAQFTGADPVNATAAVSSFDTHIEKNTLGSRLLTTK
jgi:hypothetical protein